MELPTDIQRKIALELEPYDLVSFCAVNKDTNKEICNSDIFWRLKIERDFPEIFRYFQVNKLVLRNPKTTYMRNFIELSEYIDKQVDNIREIYFKTNGTVQNPSKELGVEISNKVYKVIYDTLSDYRKMYNYTPRKYSSYNVRDFNSIKNMVNRNIVKHNLYELDTKLFSEIAAHHIHRSITHYPFIRKYMH